MVLEQSCCGLEGGLGKAGGAEKLTDLSSFEWDRGVQASHPTQHISADAGPALAGTVRRRTGGGPPCGAYQMMHAVWNTIAVVQALVLVVL